MDAEDRELFDRSLRHATASHTGEELDGELDELGWGDALAVDPEAAVALLFEHQGFANATSTGARPGARRSPRRAARRHGPARPRPHRPARRRGDGRAAWAPRRCGGQRRAAVVTTSDGADLTVLRVDAARARAAAGRRHRSSARAGRGHRRRHGRGGHLPRPRPLGGGGRRRPAGPGPRAGRAPRGRCSASPGSTPSNASSSAVPIASFQAVRHRLAETLRRRRGGRRRAGRRLARRLPLAAALAKAIAGRNGRTGRPPLPSRSWPASASPPSTPSTTTCAGPRPRRPARRRPHPHHPARRTAPRVPPGPLPPPSVEIDGNQGGPGRPAAPILGALQPPIPTVRDHIRWFTRAHSFWHRIRWLEQPNPVPEPEAVTPGGEMASVSRPTTVSPTRRRRGCLGCGLTSPSGGGRGRVGPRCCAGSATCRRRWCRRSCAGRCRTSWP